MLHGYYQYVTRGGGGDGACYVIDNATATIGGNNKSAGTVAIQNGTKDSVYVGTGINPKVTNQGASATVYLKVLKDVTVTIGSFTPRTMLKGEYLKFSCSYGYPWSSTNYSVQILGTNKSTVKETVTTANSSYTVSFS